MDLYVEVNNGDIITVHYAEDVELYDVVCSRPDRSALTLTLSAQQLLQLGTFLVQAANQSADAVHTWVVGSALESDHA